MKLELEKFFVENKINKRSRMTVAQMEKFTDLMKRGIDIKGKAHPRIGLHNKAIKGMLPKGSVDGARKLDDVLAAGRKYMKYRGFQVIAAAAVLSNILGEVVASEIKGLHVMAQSSYYKRAIRALQMGNIAQAQTLLTDDRDSLYMEINARVGATAALNFKRRMDEAFETATRKSYQ